MCRSRNFQPEEVQCFSAWYQVTVTFVSRYEDTRHFVFHFYCWCCEWVNIFSMHPHWKALPPRTLILVPRGAAVDHTSKLLYDWLLLQCSLTPAEGRQRPVIWKLSGLLNGARPTEKENDWAELCGLLRLRWECCLLLTMGSCFDVPCAFPEERKPETNLCKKKQTKNIQLETF